YDDVLGRARDVRIGQLESLAQIDDRQNRAAQLHHALDELRRLGHLGDLERVDDFLDAHDVDCVFLAADTEGRELDQFVAARLPSRVGGRRNRHFWITSKVSTASRLSRMSSLPSVRPMPERNSASAPPMNAGGGSMSSGTRRST